MDKYTNLPSGLISTSVSLIGDIRTWEISGLNGMVAAPENASGNLKEIRKQKLIYSILGAKNFFATFPGTLTLSKAPNFIAASSV